MVLMLYKLLLFLVLRMIDITMPIRGSYGYVRGVKIWEGGERRNTVVERIRTEWKDFFESAMGRKQSGREAEGGRG